MDPSSFANVRIEKLGADNFHSWKQKIGLILGHREVDEFIDKDKRPIIPESIEERSKWSRKDKLARMTIGLSLSDEMLKNVEHTSTALEMWTEICNVHQRHTLINKLAARRDFYTASMRNDEGVLPYINRVRQIASVLESMGVSIDDKEMAMAVLNGLPERFQSIITALDAIGDGDESFTLDKVRSCLLQEERRSSLRESCSSNSEAAALMNNSIPLNSKRSGKKCTFCGRKGHTRPECWDEHGKPARYRKTNSKPGQNKNRSDHTAALSADVDVQDNTDDGDHVCLLNTYALSSTLNQKSAKVWHIDSAATSHITFDRSLFMNYSSIGPFNVEMGDNSTAQVIGKGEVHLQIFVNGSQKTCKIQDVLHVPSFSYSLVSVSEMARKGFTINFRNESVIITRQGSLIASGTLTKGLYELDIDNNNTSPLSAFVSNVQLWHERLGHVHAAGILNMAKKNIVDGISIRNGNKPTEICEGCIMGKMHRSPIPKASSSRATGLLDLVHTDVAQFPQRSKGGAQYFATFIDDHSRLTHVYPLRHKSECFTYFLKYRNTVETQTGRKIRSLRSDGGGEYISAEYTTFLSDNGIIHQKTCAYTPQQNGVAERMNRTLKDLVRAMLHHKAIDTDFWAEALNTAAYIRNRVTSRGIPSNTTPYELWYSKKPSVSHMRIFGSKCWYKVPNEKVKSLDRRANEAIMLGYATGQKGYKLWDVNKHKVVVSRDVKFEELPVSSSVKESEDTTNDDPSDDDSATYHPTDETETTSNDISEAENEESTSSPTDNTDFHDEIGPITTNNQTENADESIASATAPRRSGRVCKPTSDWWKTRALASITPDHLLTYATATKGEESQSWKNAIKSEYDSLIENKTWTLVPRSQARNLLTSKWVFKRKDVSDANGGSLVKYKARLVCRGFQQKQGIDYEETYAPVIAFTTLRLFFAICASKGLEIDQMDVITAFLNGDLDKEIYMEQPEGFLDSKHPGYVCKLQKSIYGLKQASRQWHEKIDKLLIEQMGFTTSPQDPCLYVRRDSGSIVIITLYVDDLLIASNSRRRIYSIKVQLSSRFKMKDCGRAKICLGLEIGNDPGNNILLLSQTRYAEKILERFGMLNAKPVVTPMESQISSTDLEGELMDPTLYRQAIGSLMYLAVGTRPDIQFAVSRLAQYVQSPSKALWVHVKRIFRYVSGTRSFGIKYSAEEPLFPTGYTDSDWGGCKTSRKSTTGFMFTMAGGAISWKSKKQGCIALSSSEAEYIALATTVKEAIWLTNLFKFVIPTSNEKSILMHVDNQGSIKMAKNDISGNRTKHIDIQYHFARNAFNKGLYAIEYLSTEQMVADILTKPLQRNLLYRFRLKLGLVNTTHQNI